MATTRKSTRRNNRKNSGTINVTASSTISQLPPVPPTSASNSALLSRRQIMPPAPPPPRMQPTIPPSASSVLPSSSLRPFQTLLPFPSSLVPSSQQLSATAAALSSSRPLSTSARVALPSTLSSASTTPPLPTWKKRQKQHHNGHSHSINATPTILHPPLLPAVSSSAIAAASTAPSLVPSWMQHPLTSTNQRKRINDFIEQDESANNESGAASMPTLAATNGSWQHPLLSQFLPRVEVTKEGDTRDKKIMRKVKNMMNLIERKKNYPEDSECLDKKCDLFQRFALLFNKVIVTEDGLEIRPLPKSVDDHGGGYAWKYGNSLTIGQTGNFAERGRQRVKQRIGEDRKITKEEVARHMAMLYTTDECVEIANRPGFRAIFEEILAMHHPRLVCNVDKEDNRRKKVARLLVEGSIAACTPAYVEKAYENLLDNPSDEIRRITRSPKFDQDCSRVTGLAEKLIDAYSWGTAGSACHEMMLGEVASLPSGREVSSGEIEDLCRLARSPPEERFLQHFMTGWMGRDNIEVEPFINCLPSKENPRFKEMDKVIMDLTNVLTDEVIAGIEKGHIPSGVVDEVERIVNSISKEDYVEPEKAVLKEAATRVLLKLNQQYQGTGDSVLIRFERCLYKLLDDETRNKLFPADSNVYNQLDVDGDIAETVIQTKKGPNFIIVYSGHVAFGENKQEAQRIKSIKRLIASMAKNNSAGILNDDDFRYQVDSCIAFLMTWFGLDGSSGNIKGNFYHARNSVVSDRMCDPQFAVKGSQMTANAIGEGVSQMGVVMMRTFLGQRRFNALLTLRGTPTNEGNPSPIDKPDQCEVWAKQYQRQYKQEHKEEIQQYQRQYYQEHKEEIQEYQRQYKQEHKEEIQQYQRQYYQEHKEEIQEYQRQYRQEHKEYFQQYYQEHKEEILENARERQAQKSQKYKDDKAVADYEKAKRVYEKYVKLIEDDKSTFLSKPDMIDLLNYIVPKFPTNENDTPSRYTANGVIKMRQRLGISLFDKKDCLSEYFNPSKQETGI